MLHTLLQNKMSTPQICRIVPLLTLIQRMVTLAFSNLEGKSGDGTLRSEKVFCSATSLRKTDGHRTWRQISVSSTIPVFCGSNVWSLLVDSPGQQPYRGSYQRGATVCRQRWWGGAWCIIIAVSAHPTWHIRICLFCFDHKIKWLCDPLPISPLFSKHMYTITLNKSDQGGRKGTIPKWKTENKNVNHECKPHMEIVVMIYLLLNQGSEVHRKFLTPKCG